MSRCLCICGSLATVLSALNLLILGFIVFVELDVIKKIGLFEAKLTADPRPKIEHKILTKLMMKCEDDTCTEKWTPSKFPAKGTELASDFNMVRLVVGIGCLCTVVTVITNILGCCVHNWCCALSAALLSIVSAVAFFAPWLFAFMAAGEKLTGGKPSGEKHYHCFGITPCRKAKVGVEAWFFLFASVASLILAFCEFIVCANLCSFWEDYDEDYDEEDDWGDYEMARSFR